MIIATANDVAEMTFIPRAPKGREARTMARQAAEHDDEGTDDLIVSDVIRKNEAQVWFVAEHIVDTPLVRAQWFEGPGHDVSKLVR